MVETFGEKYDETTAYSPSKGIHTIIEHAPDISLTRSSIVAFQGRGTSAEDAESANEEFLFRRLIDSCKEGNATH